MYDKNFLSYEILKYMYILINRDRFIEFIKNLQLYTKVKIYHDHPMISHELFFFRSQTTANKFNKKKMKIGGIWVEICV